MKRRSAFTLIELIMVVSIIAVLIALLLPAIQSAREAARRAQCTNNLLQLGLALGNYASAHNVLPPGVVNEKGPILNLPSGYHHSWVVQILPFIGQNNVYRRFDFRYGVYHPSNMTAGTAVMSTLSCPSDSRRATSNYAGCHHDVDAPIDASNRGVLYLNSRIGYDDITDGPAYTILLSEVVGGGPSLGWASGTRATLRNTGRRINEPDLLFTAMGRGPFNASEARPQPEEIEKLVGDGLLPVGYTGGFSSHHGQGANFLFCNGAVRYVKESVNPAVYQHLANRSDGEIISDDAF
ncbi:MAG: DUF1559 domain-containing protein [Isosphaeraceae bacterium]